MIMFACRDTLDAGKESSKDDLNDSIYLIIRESEEVEMIARKVASACTEEGLKEVNSFVTFTSTHVLFILYLHAGSDSGGSQSAWHC